MSNPDELSIKKTFLNEESTSKISMLIQMGDNRSSLKALISAMKGTLEVIKKDPTASPFKSHIITEADPENFNVTIGEILNYSRLMDKGSYNAIYEISASLELKTEAEVENLVHNIFVHVKDENSSLLIHAFANNNPMVGYFIRRGMTKKIIDHLMDQSENHFNLETLIKNGFMIERFDIVNATNIIEKISLDGIFDFYSHIKDLTQDYDSHILNIIATRVTDLSCEIEDSSRLEIMNHIIGICNLEGVYQLILMDKVRDFIIQLHNQGIIVFRNDKNVPYLHLGECDTSSETHIDSHIKIVKKLIESYPHAIAKDIFMANHLLPLTTLKEFASYPTNHHSYRQMEELIACILKRDDFTSKEKTEFFQEIVRSYPVIHIERFFQLIKTFVGDSDNGWDIMTSLLLTLTNRPDIKTKDKGTILAHLAFTYPLDLLISIVGDIKPFKSSPTGSDMMVKFIIRFFTRSNFDHSDRKSLYDLISFSYSELMGEIRKGIHAHIKLMGNSPMMVKFYHKVMYEY